MSDAEVPGRPAAPRAGGRREELLGAALGGDLTRGERAELEALLRDDPGARQELDDSAALVHLIEESARAGTLGEPAGLGRWVEGGPPSSLRQRVLTATRAPRPPRQRGPATAALGLCAALVLGAVGGLALARWLDRAPQGPAGTLGALEAISFTAVPAGVSVSASLVAHTWGTETVFEEVSGLTAGQRYDVVLVADDGTEVPAGSFQAVEGPVTCRMTSATLRADVAEVSVRASDGAEVMASPLSPVEGA